MTSGARQRSQRGGQPGRVGRGRERPSPRTGPPPSRSRGQGAVNPTGQCTQVATHTAWRTLQRTHPASHGGREEGSSWRLPREAAGTPRALSHGATGGRRRTPCLVDRERGPRGEWCLRTPRVSTPDTGTWRRLPGTSLGTGQEEKGCSRCTVLYDKGNRGRGHAAFVAQCQACHGLENNGSGCRRGARWIPGACQGLCGLMSCFL